MYQGPEKKIQGAKKRYYRESGVKKIVLKKKISGKFWTRKIL